MKVKSKSIFVALVMIVVLFCQVLEAKKSTRKRVSNANIDISNFEKKCPVNIKKIALIESTNNPKAISRAGAMGLCQIMPSTWRGFAKPGEKWRNPEDNMRVSKRYFLWIQKWLKDNGDKNYNNVDHLLACYNGGIGRFKKAKFNVSRMPLETRNYVKKYHRAPVK